jgi:5,10-methylene-tetrahydrofolate dehydrogenase/methenyl tetrahydrofolate cyclohydrolase
MFHWFASRNPRFIGCIPAYHYGIPWRYMFEELYKNDLRGQNIIVMGANSVIGYEISLALAALVGANATLACRNASRYNKVAQLI